MPTTGAVRLVVAALTAAGVAACSSSGAPATPTPRPLTLAEMRALYSAAANAYNTSEPQIGMAENMYCDPHSAGASLAPCQAALNQDRQATITFDNALRAINFSGQAATDVAKLLSDDAALEKLILQAAAATSISAIAQATNQIFPALNTAADDAKKVRADLGLPQPT
jgi:hypothetical protein